LTIHHFGDLGCDPRQSSIYCGCALHVVVLLQIVNVQVEESEGSFVAMRMRNRARELDLEESAVPGGG
jgi:hypothetical protein